MLVKCELWCEQKMQSLALELNDTVPNMYAIDFSKCNVVYEDGNYEMMIVIDDVNSNVIESITVHVNGKNIGVIKKSDNNLVERYTGKVVYHEKNHNKPFLLHYDFVILSFVVNYSDGSVYEFFSDYLLCVSQNQEDDTNIKQMLQELICFNDSQVGEWLFSDAKKEIDSGLYEGTWSRKAYKSLSSYIQLLEEIISCYKNNYAYFRNQGKHTLKRSEILSSYDNVREIDVDSFNWLMKNTHQFSEVSFRSGIQYQNKNYLPHQIRTKKNEKNWDIYENRIIVSFLCIVSNNARQILNEFNKNLLNEKSIIAKINGIIPNEYYAPIITIKSMHIAFSEILLEKLLSSIKIIDELYKQFLELYDVRIIKIISLPRKTKIFQEIKPYMQVFKIIIKWFQYGEFSLERDHLLLQIKTLDKLFEYYCLMKLLKLLADKGFQKSQNENAIIKYEYKLAKDGLYQNERDVANTYILYNNGVNITLYFQPVISSIGFENDLKLFRTTKNNSYYTPDFVMKFKKLDQCEEYIILDAKFSSRYNIQNYYLSDVIKEYSCEIAVASEIRSPKMVWILQGRIKNDEKPMWLKHNSKLAKQFKPIISYGIASFNTNIDLKQDFWNEIKINILSLE